MLQAVTVKNCRVCSKQFSPFQSMQIVCSPACARKVPVIDKKAEKALLMKRREALKTRSDWIKEAQHAFNGFVRARDAGKPCICCGVPLGDRSVGGHFDCGHYRSVGSAPHLRFDPANAHGQTKKCNRYGAGRAVDYRRGLIARLGIAEVERLEADQTSPKWSVDELKTIRDTYRALTRQLLKEKEA